MGRIEEPYALRTVTQGALRAVIQGALGTVTQGALELSENCFLFYLASDLGEARAARVHRRHPQLQPPHCPGYRLLAGSMMADRS